MSEPGSRVEIESKDEGGLTEILLDLERSLMDPVFRKDRERVSALLAEEFREFGSSGRVWTKASILDLLAGEAPLPSPNVEDFAIQRIGREAVLATYRAVRKGSGAAAVQASLRSSLWVFREGRWQMFFHQGTRVPDAGC
jgi:hypothetical protein